MSFLNSKLKISFFGESHGEYIGCTIHHFPPNRILPIEKIKEELRKRHSYAGNSLRREKESFQIISGIFRGKTTGAPLTFLLANRDVNSEFYEQNEGIVRPNHSDYTSYIWSDGNPDFRGGGHFSGRLTALYTIVGAICEEELKDKNIQVASRIQSLHQIEDYSCIDDLSFASDDFPVADLLKKEEMLAFLQTVTEDSVGGKVEIIIRNLPQGLGGPLFDRFETKIGQFLFAIPGVKGIEIGDGFDMTTRHGSEINDWMQYENKKVQFLSNHSGGIQGGITNGQDVIIRLGVKPTPSIKKNQKTVDLLKKKNVMHAVSGRHDVAILLKIVHVARSLTWIMLYDCLMGE
ncbi:MAG: chorismate synthase [Bacilli bacterium]|jgi:chorismate synthase|nr:chorismate synthase [Bacilli bacterium]